MLAANLLLVGRLCGIQAAAPAVKSKQAAAIGLKGGGFASAALPRPAAGRVQKSQFALAKEKELAKKGLSQEWEVHWSYSKNRVYYFNEAKLITTYKRPAS